MSDVSQGAGNGQSAGHKNYGRKSDKHEEEKGRGRQAKSPKDIPAKGWRDIFLRVKKQIGKDNLSIVSAGVAFYSFLALFPALIATIMIYGLIVSPTKVQEQLPISTSLSSLRLQPALADGLSCSFLFNFFSPLSTDMALTGPLQKFVG